LIKKILSKNHCTGGVHHMSSGSIGWPCISGMKSTLSSQQTDPTHASWHFSSLTNLHTIKKLTYGKQEQI